MNSMLWCVIIGLLLQLLDMVKCQPNLCQNPRIDSIAYIDDQKMYFFTSGGYYWIVKENEFPPPVEKAKPLPHGFKIGEAAVYKNTLKACQNANTAGAKLEEQEIHVVEMVGSINRIMAFDLRSYEWKKPIDYNEDHSIGVAQIDWTKNIDAMFAYGATEIYVVQREYYAGIDYKPQCEDPTKWATNLKRQMSTDFNTKDPIFAFTVVKNRDLLMFQDNDIYYLVEINTDLSKDGKFSTTKKGADKSIAKDFFKFDNKCTAPPTFFSSTASTIDTSEPPLEISSKDTEPGEAAEEKSSSNEKRGGLWIIIVVISVMVVIIVIALTTFMAMRKKKPNADSGPETGKESEGTAAIGEGGAAGTVQAKSSVYGKASSGSKAGSQVSPSQTSSKLGTNSVLSGMSPSKMSVRSKTSNIPSLMTTKSSTPSKSGTDK